MKNKLIIATRVSALALWQSRYVARRLQEKYPKLQIQLLPVTTKGDKILDRPLVQIGGKGLFIKELEVLLIEKKADIAVHSLKDMTAVIPDELCLAAVTDREDPRDVFVSNRYHSLEELPDGAVVGTSSLRRQAQILHRFGNLKITTLRGNVQTRLKHLDEGRFDAVILAAAGLKRLGLQDRITSYLSTEDSIPACGQGVMAIEARKEDPDVLSMIRFLHNEQVAHCISSERAFLAKVGGDCKVPAGIYAVPEGQGKLKAEAFIASPGGTPFYKAEKEGPLSGAEEIGSSLAEKLLAMGGSRVLKELAQIEQ